MNYSPIAVSAVVLVAACSSSAQAPRQPAPTDVVATVGSTSITMAEVDDKALQQPASNFGSAKLFQALYAARLAALDDLIATNLLAAEAKAQHLESAALVDKEITSKIVAVKDADVSAWYQANQGRVQGRPLEQVRSAIASFLSQERIDAVRREYLEALKTKTAVRIMLEPPRQTIAATDSPSRGPASAPIELIEFSDFQCPFCQRANPTVQQVLTTYGDRIRFVYRHYPLPNHPNARPAAEASACAAEQGKFWPYHDRLFSGQAGMTDGELKQHAVAVGLDAAKFNGCVDAHKFKALVDADVHAGEEAGVNGTPAFFINGRMLSGAQPYDAFKKIIDEELKLKPR